MPSKNDIVGYKNQITADKTPSLRLIDRKI
ncbi:hypothetical protein HNQ03_002385 [Chryseobacterium sp. 16F]|uniref:Uncharacterized protein n=1 Tax=Frigoriflavimonas asaccharolytica TaxID=2735899 RepID=A0A8J8G8A4_9FLAO|nr:hypothetical protein [Frigoriflavimonas asaccharolytica]